MNSEISDMMNSNSTLFVFDNFLLQKPDIIIERLKLTSNDVLRNPEQLYITIIDNFINIVFKIRYLFYLVWPSETMFADLFHVPRYVEEMFPVFIMIGFVEIIIRFIQGKVSLKLNQSIASLSAGIFQEAFRINVRSIEVLMYCFIYNNFKLFSLPWNSLTTWLICYLAVDLGFYWAHRLAHEVNFIWAIHQAHHSSEDFSIISALRQAVLQPFTAWITYTPLALFIPPQIFLVHLQLSELYMACLHTEVIDDIGILGYILNCPSHHRVHHSRNPEYIDKNYGGMLIIWDRIFGTFKAEDRINVKPVYGLVHPLESFNPFYVQFHTWPTLMERILNSKSWIERLKIVFYGPGWQPGANNRLGNIEDIPKVSQFENRYDPKIHLWKTGYVLVHFTMITFFYHELTHTFKNMSQQTLLVNISALLGSTTTISMILDNNENWHSYELIRCIIFFTVYNSSSSGYFIVRLIAQTIFILSIFINLLCLRATGCLHEDHKYKKTARIDQDFSFYNKIYAFFRRADKCKME